MWEKAQCDCLNNFVYPNDAACAKCLLHIRKSRAHLKFRISNDNDDNDDVAAVNLKFHKLRLMLNNFCEV